MASILHGNATTTPRIRKEIQNSEKSLVKLAKQYGINPKTVLKWKHRTTTEDQKTGPKTRRSALSELEQLVVCEVRKTLLLPLDDLFIMLKPIIPALTRSNLHRCLQYYGISQLPKPEKPREKKVFKAYPIGYLHIDITEFRLKSKKYYLFVAIDRKTKYVYAELYDRMTSSNAVLFLKNLQSHCCFKITHILTDNGAQFTYNLLTERCKPKSGIHSFDALCLALGIEHRTTKFRHPWTNGQVEITNKMLKEATIKKYHYENVDYLKAHLQIFLLYYNFQKQLKALKYKTPWQMIEECYDLEPERFSRNPNDKIMGLNN